MKTAGLQKMCTHTSQIRYCRTIMNRLQKYKYYNLHPFLPLFLILTVRKIAETLYFKGFRRLGSVTPRGIEPRIPA